jgi:hypothetical protein
MQRLQSWNKSRKTWIRNKRKTYFIYCWWKTEKLYFQWMRKDLSTKINIEIIEMWWLDCVSLLQKTIKEKQTRWFDPMDKYYLIIDRDPWNNSEVQIKKIMKNSTDNSITTIINNISIEVWFIMHYKCFMEWNNTVEKYIKKLSKLMWCKYSKTDENIYLKLSDKTTIAIENSIKNEKILKETCENTPVYLNEPYTNMYNLINDIRKNLN